ncbi:MAG: glucose 1-dehydrogenase [Candidatus Aminicenantes bacterium]|nr:glucose 1-dehydrogenase [Candidatus Aminicenantes bacterium]
MCSEAITLSLSGQVAVVTGGSRGLGRAIALLFAKAGAHIVVNYIKNKTAADELKKEAEKYGVQVLVEQGNIADYDDCKKILEKTLKQFNKVDILVNNAGIWEPGHIGDIPPDSWQRVINVNLTGVYNFTNLVVPVMKRQKRGNIINVSSRCSRRGEEGSSSYVATKAALNGFTRSIALELGPYNIRANGVAPAWIYSDMTNQHLNEKGVKEEILKTIPLGRIGDPEDVAHLCLFLASDLSSYLTGETIFLSGGSI